MYIKGFAVGQFVDRIVLVITITQIGISGYHKIYEVMHI